MREDSPLKLTLKLKLKVGIKIHELATIASFKFKVRVKSFI